MTTNRPWVKGQLLNHPFYGLGEVIAVEFISDVVSIKVKPKTRWLMTSFSTQEKLEADGWTAV